MTGCFIRRVGFLLQQGSTFIFRHLTLKKALKGLLQNTYLMLDFLDY